MVNIDETLKNLRTKENNTFDLIIKATNLDLFGKENKLQLSNIKKVFTLF